MQTRQDDGHSSSRQVVLILRLVLDRHAALRHGELFDADARRLGRFASQSSMTGVISQWLARQAATGTGIDQESRLGKEGQTGSDNVIRLSPRASSV